MKPTVWSAPALLMCVCLCTFAQSTKGDVLIGVSLSGTEYIGDINVPGGNASVSLRPGFDVYVRKAIPKRVQTEFRCGYLNIIANNPTLAPVRYSRTGEGDTLIQPNTYTETPVIYANLNARLNFCTSGTVFPYATAGLMGASYYPRFSDGILLSRKTSFRAPTDRKYGAYTVMLPLSLGADFQINPNLLVGLGYTYTLSGTDYLDNIAVLGTRKGNDQLHTLRMGAAFSFLHKELPTNAPSKNPTLTEDEQLVAEALGNAYEPKPSAIPGEVYFVRLKSMSRNINPLFVMHDTTRMAAAPPVCDCDSLTRQFEKRIAELRQERDILRIQYNDLLDDVSAMTLLSDSIRNQLYLKESVIVELAGKSPSRSRGTIDSLMAEMGKLRFRLSESEMLRTRLRQRTDSLQTEADLQTTIAAALEKQIVGLQTTHAADETLQTTLGEYKKDLALAQRENKRMKQQLESGTSPYKQINELQATIEGLQREYNIVQARLKTMEPMASRADSLQKVVDRLRTSPVTIAPSASPDDISTQLALARAESEQLALELERALDARREMDHSVGELQEELAQMRHENTQMQTLVDDYASRPAPAPVVARPANVTALEEENIRLRRESAILNEQLKLASDNAATQTAKLEREIQLGQTERKGMAQAYEQRIAELQADLNRVITSGAGAGNQAIYAENQRLKEEIAQTRADISRLEAVAQEASSGINTELERLTAENDRLSGDIRARETEYAQLYTQFEEVRNTLSALGGEDLKRKNTDLTEQVQRLQDRLATVEAGGNTGPTTTQYEQQILSLKQQLNHLQSVLKNPYNRLDQALVTANEQLERAVGQKETELSELRKQTDPQLITRIKEELEAARKALDVALTARAQAEAALADGRIAVKQAEGRMGVLEQQLSEARVVASKAQDERIQQKNQLETALATEKTAKARLETDIRRLQRDLDTLHAQYSALANAGQITVDQQVTILTSEKNRLGEQVFALNKRQGEMQSEVARLQADAEEANALRQQLDEIRRSTLSNDQKVMQEQLVKTRESYSRLQEEYQTLQARAATNDPSLLRNQIERLQKQLADDREQVAMLYAENNELRRKINLSNLAPSAEEQVLHLRNDNDALTRRITEEQTRNKKLYEEMVAMQRAQGTGDVMQQIEEAQKQTKLAQQKIAEAERQRADALGKMRIQNVEMETLRTRLAIAEREAQNYQKQLEAAQIAASTQPAANPAATAALQQARDEAERQRKQAIEAADKAEMATQEAQMAYEKTTLMLKKAETEITSLNGDVARLSAEVVRLNGNPQAVTATAQPQAASLDPAQLQALKAQLADAQTRLTQSQSEIAKQGKDLAGERANGKRLFDENQQLLRERNMFAALQTELASAKTQVEDLARHNTDMRTQLDALAQQKRTLEQELAARNSAGDPCESLKADLQDLQRRYADLLYRSRENDTEIALAQAQRSDFANRLADANRQINTLEAEVVGLRARTPGAAPTAGSGDVAQLLQLKQQQVDQLDARVQSREAEVRELKTRLQQATAGQQDMQSVTNELAESRKRILLLEQQLKNQPGGAANLPQTNAQPSPTLSAVSGLNTNLTPANDPSPDVQAQADQIMPHAFVVPSASEKTVVRDRIVRYFASLGATYQMVDGKLFYDNVLIPEISDKPLDITFYMLRDGRGNKQLLGSFTTSNGAYLSKQEFPLETYYARLLLTQLAQ